MAEKDICTLGESDLEKVAGGMITQEEALAKALEHVQLEKEQIDLLKKVKLDFEHGRKVFEVEFYHDGFEYEFDIDAMTGTVLKYEKDRD